LTFGVSVIFVNRMVILNSSTYQSFVKDINGKDIFIDYVLKNSTAHTAENECLVVFIRNVENNNGYVINNGHPDLFPSNVNVQHFIDLTIQYANRTFVVDKKRFINLFKNKNVNDILIFKFQEGLTGIADLEFDTNYHTFVRYKNIGVNTSVNYIIPIAKHIELFDTCYEFFQKDLENFNEDSSYTQMNGIITETLSDVECNGLYVDVDLFKQTFPDKHVNEDTKTVYSEYNIFTSTGRPSNRFEKINYAALNKENGCRRVFTSRFGNNGMLLNIDYSAYHPHIIANLINFKLDLDVDIYRYLGQQYFHKDDLTDEDIAESKNLTFKNLYGGIRDEYKHIEYFKKVNEYINHRWSFFLENEYVETPIFKRRITSKHIIDPNPNKLFNYLLQASETEFSIQNINRVNEYLINKKSKVVLYNYDSILIDICKDDKKETLLHIKEIMINNQFPIKCYVGNNYHDLVKININ